MRDSPADIVGEVWGDLLSARDQESAEDEARRWASLEPHERDYCVAHLLRHLIAETHLHRRDTGRVNARLGHVIERMDDLLDRFDPDNHDHPGALGDDSFEPETTGVVVERADEDAREAALQRALQQTAELEQAKASRQVPALDQAPDAAGAPRRGRRSRAG